MLTRSRSLTVLTLLLAAFLALPAPAWATASTRLDLQTSAAQTATGNGGGIPVPAVREVLVFFDCTASSGTGETLDVLLQTSSDGGTTWFDMVYETAVSTDGDGTETTPTEWDRDYVNLGADVACSGVRAVALYRDFGDLIRVKWFIAGTTPSYTFSVKAIGKN